MMITPFVLALSLAGSGAAAAAPDEAPVRVYLFTAAAVDGFNEVQFKRRIDTVDDLRKDLARKKGVELATDPDQADVVLQVIETRIVRQADVPGGAETVGVELTAGSDRALLRASASRDALLRWRDAAGGVAKAIARWIDEHRNTLITRRATASNAR
jgi:hypothetical protein